MRVGCVLFLVAVTGVCSLKYATFNSPGISLRSGQIANTPNDFGPLEWINEPIVIHNFSAILVGGQEKTRITSEEVYVHHWLIFADGNAHNGGVCAGLPNVFGIGAEMSHTMYQYPYPYGVVTTGNETWTANLHFIRTTNVVDIQSCIECHCNDSRPPEHPHGSVGCCPDGGLCWGMWNSTINDPKSYYLQYTIGYTPYSEMPNAKPLTVFAMDATAKDTYDCDIEYDIPALADGEIHNLTAVSVVPSNWSMVYMYMHQHIGGLNFTVSHYRNGTYIGQVCAAVAKYGSGGDVAGNETGYLIEMPYCIWEKPYQLLAQDELRLESLYTNRGLKGGHNWHEGVMALVFMAAVAAPIPEAVCLDEFHKLCGSPPYKDFNTCITCAENHRLDLFKKGCTVPLLNRECEKNGGGGNIPAPDTVDNMGLSITRSNSTSHLHIIMTGPKNVWFGCGYNPTQPYMKDAEAFIYSYSKNLSRTVLQHRILGNHFAGQLIQEDYPVLETVVGTKNITLTFELNAASTLAQKLRQPHVGDNSDCWLFASGTVMDGMDFQYHGSTRGATCGIQPPP